MDPFTFAIMYGGMFSETLFLSIPYNHLKACYKLTGLDWAPVVSRINGSNKG